MWLFVGGDSEIGAASHGLLRERGRSIVATTRRRAGADPGCMQLDLGGDLAGWEPPAGTSAACIFAAVARLAPCAADPVASAPVNVSGTLALIERLIARDIHVLFLSSNQVFDGSKPNMPADAPPAPVSEYGRQKARTEAALRTHMRRGAPVAILRLAKVVSPQTALVREWMAALRAGRAIRAFHDMTVAPAPVETVARAIETLLGERARGIFQLTGPRDVAYLEVGRWLAARLSADPSLVVAASVDAAALPTGAAPPHTTLDSTVLCERYGISTPDPRDVIAAVAAPPLC